MFLMLIAASIVSAYIQGIPKLPKKGNYKLIFLKIPILFVLIFAIFVGVVRFNSELHTRNALAAHRSGNWESVIHEIDRADSWFYNLDPTSTPLMWYKGMANFLKSSSARAR